MPAAIINNFRSNLPKIFGYWLCLCGSFLISVQVRLTVLTEQPVPDDYRAQHIGIYLLLFLSVTVGWVISELLASSVLKNIFSTDHPFRRFLLGAFLATGAVRIIDPLLSSSQLAAFLIASIIIGLLTIAIPHRIYFRRLNGNMVENMRRLKDTYPLIVLWSSYNIQTRYTQTILGIAWIVLLPVATAIVIAFAISSIMRYQLDVPFIAFLLIGLVPYNMFSNGIIGSTVSVIGRIAIVKQVYFPREALTIITGVEILVDFFFAFAILLIVDLLYGLTPNIYFLYLPFLIALLCGITFGFMLIASSLSLLVRDIPQLLAVGLQLAFYATPIIYPAESLPAQYQVLTVINPLASVITSFRDIMIYGRAPSIVSLYFPTVLAVVVLWLGYCVFKSIEPNMADLA